MFYSENSNVSFAVIFLCEDLLCKRQYKLLIAYLTLGISEDGLQTVLSSDPASHTSKVYNWQELGTFLVHTRGQNQSWDLVPELSFLHV